LALVELSVVEQRYRAVLEVSSGVPVSEAGPLASTGGPRSTTPEAMRSLVTNMAVPSGFTPGGNKALRDTNFPCVVPV
jgi:hypothetical protein